MRPLLTACRRKRNYELFRGMTEDECIVVRRPGQVYMDCRYAVTDHLGKSRHEK